MDIDICIVISYLWLVDESWNFEDILGVEFDWYLFMFFMIVKKYDGNEYELVSLCGMFCSVECYLKMKNYWMLVIRDFVFLCIRYVLKYK